MFLFVFQHYIHLENTRRKEICENDFEFINLFVILLFFCLSLCLSLVFIFLLFVCVFSLRSHFIAILILKFLFKQKYLFFFRSSSIVENLSFSIALIFGHHRFAFYEILHQKFDFWREIKKNEETKFLYKTEKIK